MTEFGYTTMNRPSFDEITSAEDFDQWYWLKSEMIEYCRRAGMPTHGRKPELRDRIIYALDHGGETIPSARVKKESRFDWAKANLTLDTRITDNVTFGPNFRKFMQLQIGTKFTCNSDFMKWVRTNPGKTLRDAVNAWLELEERKEDPGFRSVIAEYNMFNQYVRDFIDDNPGMSIKEARVFWLRKRKLPARNGKVKYEHEDLKLLG